jgi:hypothetical protein
MAIVGWIMMLLAVIALICAMPWLCTQLFRSMQNHWRNSSSSGSAFNPPQELVQPQARHVIEVHEQRFEQKGEGSPADPGSKSLPADLN